MPLIFNGTSGLSELIISSGTGITPQGRLTLESGVPVSSTDQTGKATVYYTPYLGNLVPVYNGSQFIGKAISELSNDTTQSSTLDAGAAAAGPYQIQDCFVWNNSGTNRLTRGPKWTASATATMTIAAPCVVTWTAHGLWDGATVRFTTTGALPTGLAVNTDYFVTKIDANTFNLSTTLANQVAGTKITTSGSQSGVHTVFNYTSVRGTGAATTELQLLNGIYVNKYDITNGPAATKGTYVGSVYFNASSQIDLKFGSHAASFGEANIGIWNQYNRVDVAGMCTNSTASWSTQGGGVYKAFHLSATARASMVSGQAEDSPSATAQTYITCDGATSIRMDLAFRTITTGPIVSARYVNNGNNSSPAPLTHDCTAPPFLGLGYFIPMDGCINYTSSYVNSNSFASYVSYKWRY